MKNEGYEDENSSKKLEIGKEKGDKKSDKKSQNPVSVSNLKPDSDKDEVDLGEVKN
jgi:hypothetical protein